MTIHRVRHDKTSFHSKAEKECYEFLKNEEALGIIKDLECQVRTKLLNGIAHDTDFKYTIVKDNEQVWAEYKGFEDARWRMVKKIWKRHGPGRLFIYKGKGLRLMVNEIIVPTPDGVF